MSMAAENKILDYIQLINSANIGPVTFYKLLRQYGSAEAALAALPAGRRTFSRSAAQKEFELARRQNIRLLAFDDPEYPENLRAAEDAPPVIYVRGQINCLRQPLSLSIVGARNASLNGRKLASQISCELTSQGIMIVSGMARGIDTAAHKGAMFALNRSGSTVAVLGTGIDIAYPAENQKLCEQIAGQGAVISEFPLGTEPSAGNFPRRNRIVSALTDGTLVVEASLHSGSLITARLALEQGRDVFAVPGFPTDERSAGPNKLIKDGAFLVENAEDILNVLSADARRKIPRTPRPVQTDLFVKPLDKESKTADIPDTASPDRETDILSLLTPAGVYVDELIRVSGLDSAAVSLRLLELEMEGRIERQVGNKVALIK
ncbi:MAG TPA: DNA-protecting protein DprA [Candidatus Scatocola faecipullorum]|uniref:DNA-protecting protein DprA n=1 Tax=Candidatus Scatocola faecipullorum TaxID=2840917 RepID=A0A9D1M4U4_9PROT|nr:DNA-protecting protein DprA [Candidatus Scatocola faecipullorum]